jgi:hypothetical protein
VQNTAIKRSIIPARLLLAFSRLFSNNYRYYTIEADVSKYDFSADKKGAAPLQLPLRVIFSSILNCLEHE